MEPDLVRRALTAALLGSAAALAAAQPAAYPSQPVRIVVPQPPGGGFDSVARQLADKLAPLLGQPVVVENRPGSGTLVGTEAVAKAPADGYTLLLGALSNIALNPGLYPKLSYDPLRDFKPVGLAVTYSYTLQARRDLPLATLKDVVDYARANPDRLTYASAGNGSGQHVAAAVLAQLAKVKMVHIPYKGAQPAYQDLLGGRVDLFFDISPTARVQVDAGNTRALAVSSRERQPFHPDVPSVVETGIAPLEMDSWFGLFAPAATPAPVLQRLRSEFAKVMAQPDTVERFVKSGGRPLQLGPEATEKLVRDEVAKWTQLVRASGIAID